MSNFLKRRDLYLNGIAVFRDSDFIKFISGVRSCGKSSLLDLYSQHLIGTGVDPSAVIRMDFEFACSGDAHDFIGLYCAIKGLDEAGSNELHPA